MNIKQFRYVFVLAHEGTFSRASSVLNISQPSLSQYIKKIENQLGMPIFERTGGDVRLTDAGKIYIEVGRQIFDLEHQMEVRLSDIRQEKSGSIVIGAAPFRSAGMMPIIVKAFQTKYPGFHLIIDERGTTELLDGAEHGEFDLCLVTLPVNEHLFQYEKIMEEEIILAVPPDYPSFETKAVVGRKYKSIDARQIDGKSFVMVQETQVMQRALNNLCIDYNLKLKKAAVVKALESQISMVRAGVGLALVPVGIERFCPPGEVQFYSFQQELPRREVVVMWPKDRKLSRATRALIDIMKTIQW